MMVCLWLLVALATLSSAATVEKRDISSSYSNFEPSPLVDVNDLKVEGRQDSPKSPKGGEDPQGNLYYYYHPSEEGGPSPKTPYEEREDSGADGSYTYYDPIESADGSSSYGSTGGGSSYGSVASTGYGGGDMDFKDTSHFVKIAIPLFLLGAVLLGFSSLTFGLTGKRSFNQEPSFMQRMEMEVDKVFNTYLNAIESDQCTQRIICEAGHYARGYSIAKYLSLFIEKLVPRKMYNNAKLFKTALLTSKDMNTCKVYKCKQ